ncbi:MAG TPA: hypothetical protein VFK05_01730 [Polyangiaceae bacterium]|nr:hypothetical protein [Polyangiaceae bacterium]
MGYSWRLPDDWDFVDPGLFWSRGPVPTLDVYAAQRSADGPFVLVLASDIVRTVPEWQPGDDPANYDVLEKRGAEALQEAAAELTSTRRLQTFGVETVEVNGTQGKLRISVRLLYVGYRRFEFRCFRLVEQDDCSRALRGFLIQDLPEATGEQEVPQVRHLRDARFGVAFDAPDDSWLSLGPHFAGGGVQVVWIWRKSGRRIEIRVIDLEDQPNHLEQAEIASKMASDARAYGDRVVEGQTAFAGRLWEHHELSQKRRGARDRFILIQQDALYDILVTQPTRDRSLTDAVKQGFRLIPRSSESGIGGRAGI